MNKKIPAVHVIAERLQKFKICIGVENFLLKITNLVTN